MATGSLVLRISADLTEFSANLNKMTRQVDRAANTVAGLGSRMTLGITLPVTLAAVALGRMAAENEVAAARMRRSFGPAVDQVQARLDRLMKTMPVAGTEMQDMATRVNNMAKGIGLAAPQSARLSVSVLQMSNDLAAFANVPVQEAVDTVTAALQGQAKGLKELGVAITSGQVKNEAYRLGLLKTGEELTPLGTALATYSLMTQRAAEFTGAAARQQNTASMQFRLLKRDAIEVADRLSALLLPALRLVVGMLREVIAVVQKVPNWFWLTAASIAAVAAAIGPALFLGARLVQTFYTLKAAVEVLMAANALPRLISTLNNISRNPKLLIALVAIAAAAGAIGFVYTKVRRKIEEDSDAAGDSLEGIRDLMNGILGDTSTPGGSAIQQMQQRAQQLATALEQAAAANGDMQSISNEMVSLNEQVLTLYNQQTDKLSEQAIILQGLVLQLTTAQRLRSVMSAMTLGRDGTLQPGMNPQASISAAAESPVVAKMRVAGAAIQMENNLRQREAALAMAQVFDATRVATLEMREGFLRTSQDFAKAAATLKTSWKPSNIGGGVMAGLQSVGTALMASFTPVALVVAALGPVLRELQPIIDLLAPPLAAMGRILAIMIVPILRILFPVLKVFGIVTALIAELIAKAAAFILTGVGKLLIGIGKLLNLLPGSIGNPLKRAGNQLLQWANDLNSFAGEMGEARRDLMRMKFGDTSDAVDELGDAARETAEALLNVPTGFKLALAQFRAQNPFVPGGGAAPPLPPPSTPSSPGGIPGGTPRPTGGGETTVVNLVLDGTVIARAVLNAFQQSGHRQRGSTVRWAEIQTV